MFLLHDETRYFYGFPADEHGFKVGLYHHLRQVTTADSVDRSVSSADEEALRQCVRRYFPGTAALAAPSESQHGVYALGEGGLQPIEPRSL